MTSLIFITRYTDNEAVYYVCTIASILGGIILFYYGYIFLILYGVLVLKRNVGAFVVLLSLFVPSLLLMIIILGFLYGSGPLRAYLEKKVEETRKLNEK